MTDIYDQASDREEQDRNLAIEHHRKANKSLLPVGSCYFCDSAINESRIFCDKECADDWEMEQSAKKRNGGKAI